MNMHLTSKIVINAHVSHAVIDDELIIINLENNAYFRMNRIGADVWALLEKKPSLQEIFTAIQARYDVDVDTCLKDISQLLLAMIKNGILHIEDAVSV